MISSSDILTIILVSALAAAAGFMVSYYGNQLLVRRRVRNNNADTLRRLDLPFLHGFEHLGAAGARVVANNQVPRAVYVPPGHPSVRPLVVDNIVPGAAYVPAGLRNGRQLGVAINPVTRGVYIPAGHGNVRPPPPPYVATNGDARGGIELDPLERGPGRVIR